MTRTSDSPVMFLPTRTSALGSLEFRWNVLASISSKTLRRSVRAVRCVSYPYPEHPYQRETPGSFSPRSTTRSVTCRNSNGCGVAGVTGGKREPRVQTRARKGFGAGSGSGSGPRAVAPRLGGAAVSFRPFRQFRSYRPVRAYRPSGHTDRSGHPDPPNDRSQHHSDQFERLRQLHRHLRTAVLRQRPDTALATR